jgi:hypothetical protein
VQELFHFVTEINPFLLNHLPGSSKKSHCELIPFWHLKDGRDSKLATLVRTTGFQRADIPTTFGTLLGGFVEPIREVHSSRIEVMEVELQMMWSQLRNTKQAAEKVLWSSF